MAFVIPLVLLIIIGVGVSRQPQSTEELGFSVSLDFFNRGIILLEIGKKIWEIFCNIISGTGCTMDSSDQRVG